MACFRHRSPVFSCIFLIRSLFGSFSRHLSHHLTAPFDHHLICNLSHLPAFPLQQLSQSIFPSQTTVLPPFGTSSVRMPEPPETFFRKPLFRLRSTHPAYRFGSLRTSCRSSSFFTTTPTKGKAFRIVSAGIPPICRALIQSISSDVLGFLRMSRMARIL